MSAAMVQPAPGWLRALADARAEYQELLGWPVSVRVGDRALVVAVGGTLGAVVMPAMLGARVLACWEGQPAAVVTNADGTRWTFFCKPVAPDDLGIPASQVELVPAGSHVAIPSESELWIRRPAPGRALPSTSELLVLARQLHEVGCLRETA
jgi:hypothetical protein